MTTTIQSAIQSGDVAEVKRLIDAGCNINEENEDGISPLFYTILVRNKQMFDARTPILQLLIDAGADVDVKTNHIQSYVWYAVKCCLAF